MSQHTPAAVPSAEGPRPDDTVTGYSRRMSFDEAFADALAKLPPFVPAHPDTLETVRVVEIGRLSGGIGGLSDLYVRVERTHD